MPNPGFDSASPHPEGWAPGSYYAIEYSQAGVLAYSLGLPLDYCGTQYSRMMTNFFNWSKGYLMRRIL